LRLYLSIKNVITGMSRKLTPKTFKIIHLTGTFAFTGQ
jgi:hypothetical protein